MKIDGRCHCGFITFEARADPETTVVCNCTDCQMLGGGAFRVNVPTEPDSFRLLTGEPTRYEKIAESGNRREHAFCPRCGSPIYTAPAPGGPNVYRLRFGTLTQRAAFAPRVQIWARSQPAWVDDIGSVPKFETQPEDGPHAPSPRRGGAAV